MGVGKEQYRRTFMCVDSTTVDKFVNSVHEELLAV